MISRLIKWERKFCWLDGGGGGGGGGDGEGVGVGPGEGDGEGAGGPGPGPGEGEGGGPGAVVEPGEPKAKELKEGWVDVGLGVPIQRAIPKEEEAPKGVRKKRRPTLLTQLEGLLTGSGVRRSLIGRR